MATRPKNKVPEKLSAEEQLEKREQALRIKVLEQVLACTGEPPNYDHGTITFVRPHLRQCRVNLVCRKATKDTILSGYTLHIPRGCSFYLNLTPFGEIASSNPPMRQINPAQPTLS